MRDAVALKQHGVFAAVVVTSHFEILAKAQAQALGAPDLPVIVVSKSFASLTLDELEPALNVAAEQVIELLKKSI